MTPMTGKRALMEQLLADGVRYIFGNPGTTEQPFMDLLQEYPRLQFILCLHEGVAVSMGDSYARATRRPAFVELHVGPGLGNGSGMLFNARTGHSPLVVYVGQGESRAMFQEPHLTGDLVAIARPVSKWAYQVEHAADLPQALRRAFKVADEPPQGPVVLSIPMDVMDQQAELAIQPTSFTRWRVRPDPAAIDEAAALLRAARRPLVLVGDEVAVSGAQDEVGQVAERLGAPITHGYAAEANFPAGSPLYCGALPFINSAAMQGMLSQHDVLLAVGSPLFRVVFPEPGGIVPPEMRVIHVDLDPWELGKNVPGVLGIQADPKAALQALLEALPPLPEAEARCAQIVTANQERRERRLAQDRRAWDETPISVPRLMGELAAALPPEAAIFDESITSAPTLARHIPPRPGRYFRARGGGLGPGMPGTVALKLAMPDRPVVGVVGDGAAMYTITALWTAAHHRVPVVWVICNNASYRILKLNVLDYLGPAGASREFIAMDLTDPPLRFDRLAESMGVHGRRVERPEELRPALDEALALGAPALVDVVIQGRVP